MFGPKIRIEASLLQKAEKRAQELGYGSVDEYLSHLIEQDLQKLTPAEDEAVQERLRGLGYL
ncbi:hypothetical protein JST97_08195 [bacterium]|nr:hypothetical protein [bacterium]